MQKEPTGPHPLKAWFKSKKITQRQLAKKLEVAPETLNTWLNGKRPMPRTVELALEHLKWWVQVLELNPKARRSRSDPNSVYARHQKAMAELRGNADSKKGVQND